MKIRLIEDVHIEWCPAGTEGELIIENDFIHKFFPDPIPEGCPWTDGIYIGDAKYEIIESNSHST